MKNNLYKDLSENEEFTKLFTDLAMREIDEHMIAQILRPSFNPRTTDEAGLHRIMDWIIGESILKMIDPTFQPIIVAIIEGYIPKSEYVVDQNQIDMIYQAVLDAVVAASIKHKDEIIKLYKTTPDYQLTRDKIYSMIPKDVRDECILKGSEVVKYGSFAMNYNTYNYRGVQLYTPVDTIMIKPHHHLKTIYPQVYGCVILQFRFTGEFVPMSFSDHFGQTDDGMIFGIPSHGFHALEEYLIASESDAGVSAIKKGTINDIVRGITMTLHETNAYERDFTFKVTEKHVNHYDHNVAGFSAMTITIKDKTCNKLKYLTFIFAKNDDCVSMIPMEFDLDDLEN